MRPILGPLKARICAPRGGIDWGGDTSEDYTKPTRLYKAPTDYTKPLRTVQRPDILYKAPPKVSKNFSILYKKSVAKQKVRASRRG